jgi:hypothetical protein
MRYIIYITLLLLKLPNIIFSQVDTTDIHQDNIDYEFLLEETSAENENSQLLDLIEEYKRNPVDINYANLSELLKIPFINYSLAENIISYRNRHGEFSTKNDLLKINSTNQNEIKNLFPFIVIKDKPTPSSSFFSKHYSVYFRNRASFSVQKRKGEIEHKYADSGIKSYNRLIIEMNNNIELSFLSEKDAGEKSITDFTSFHISFSDILFLNKLVIGDYLIESGQGLAIWSPYAFSKGNNAVTGALKRDRNIVGYTSSDENQFYRGAAVNFDFNIFSASFFYSNNKIDANVDTLTNRITSLPLSGYHRTGSEIQHKNSINRKVLGGKINYRIGDILKLEALYYNLQFSKEILQKDQFSAAGGIFNFYSTAYSFSYDNFKLSGEFSYNGRSVASINNILINIGNDLDYILSVRNYPRNYYNFYSHGFGESSTTKNEFGIYTGFEFKSNFGKFNFYYDQFTFPTAGYFVPLPGKGYEFLLNFNSYKTGDVYLGFKYKFENKEVTEIKQDKNLISTRRKSNIRAELKYAPSSSLRLRTRIEYLFLNYSVSNNNERGYLLYQDARIDFTNNLRLYGRLVLFQTDSYASRLYEFENDVRGKLNNPGLFGNGIRWYLLAEYKIFDFLKISAKYSELYKPDETTLGSGNNEIANNVLNKVTLQFDFNIN